MKNGKQRALWGAQAIFGMILVFASCANDTGPDHTHDYDTVWKNNESQHWHECDCGKKSDIANHTWGSWAQTTLPTITAEGEEIRSCSVCEKTETRSVDKLVECDCPNGSLHLEGETCCEGEDCACEKDVVGVRSNVPGKATDGMAITNREGVANFVAMVTEVNTALDHTQIASETRQAYIKDHITEIRIVSPNASPASVSDNVLIVGADLTAAGIRSAINTWLVTNSL
ncbi:MAG: hypothetical protein LBH20_05110 [Treponema sp.]|jgi:hypothetical protein|nr:hypothetical protein [Treponema sp.]